MSNISKQLKQTIYIVLISLALTSCTSAPKSPPTVELPEYGINHQNIGLLVKNNDPLSLQTAKLYQKLRSIPDENIFYLDLPNSANLSPNAFNTLYQNLTQQVGDHIQAFVATWQAPYRVGCMSITSALAFDYDQKWCQPKKKGCFPTPNSSYFNSDVNLPWQTLKIRPSMLLTGKNMEEVTALIQRGVLSDGTQPEEAHAYLIHTKDKARSARGLLFEKFSKQHPSHSLLQVHFIDARKQNRQDSIAFKENIMFYQTGLKHVPDIQTNHYLSGAIADHLTSSGGQGLNETGQMKAFRWLEAGVTGSYGTVVEPCSFRQKFPNPFVLIPKYLQGETLIEAYWKSVQQPSEGLFIGEPLARPYALLKASISDGKLTVVTNRLKPDKPYQLLEWQAKSQRFKPIVARFHYTQTDNQIIIQANNAGSNKYKVVEMSAE